MSADRTLPRRRPRRPVFVALVAFASLVIGFSVAQSTGARWLGAVILVVGAIVCALAILPVEGMPATAILAVVYVAALVISHPLGRAIGTWPSVLSVALVTGVVGYAVTRPTGSRVSTT